MTAFDGGMESSVAAAVYRYDGTAEWRSEEAPADDWSEALAAARERLEDAGVAELAPGVVARRLVGIGDREAARVLILCERVEVPEWLKNARLTPRQREVAEMASYGATADELAAHFGISPHTVRQHLKLVYRELGVANRVELAQVLRLVG